jgi:hypothetical protein
MWLVFSFFGDGGVESLYIAHAGLELGVQMLHLLQPPDCWDYSLEPLHLAGIFL